MSLRRKLLLLRGINTCLMKDPDYTPVPYIRIYVILPLWIVSVSYSVRVRDNYSFSPVSRVEKTLAENANVVDAYSLTKASLVTRTLAETCHVTDSYHSTRVNRVIRNLEETPHVSDAYSLTKATRKIRLLAETPHVTDAYSFTKANLVVRHLAETVHVTDAYSMVKATKVTRSLNEVVRVQEVGLEIGPWADDPTKKLWVYYAFEKPLSEDGLTRGYQYVTPGKTTLDEPVKVADAYSTTIIPKQTRNLPEVSSVADAYVADVFTEWWLGTKYVGHVEAETIYNFVVTKYDGHLEAEVIYNFVVTKYDGYVESTVSP
jgi:DNA-binding Lrp family transcriptional regulator